MTGTVLSLSTSPGVAQETAIPLKPVIRRSIARGFATRSAAIARLRSVAARRGTVAARTHGPDLPLLVVVEYRGKLAIDFLLQGVELLLLLGRQFEPRLAWRTIESGPVEAARQTAARRGQNRRDQNHLAVRNRPVRRLRRGLRDRDRRRRNCSLQPSCLPTRSAPPW